MIDWTRVQELRDEIGEEDFAEVVTLFLEEVEEVLERMRAAAAPETLEAELHFLKGSAMNLGFRALSALCHRDAHESGAPHIERVVQVYAQSRQAFFAGGPSAASA